MKRYFEIANDYLAIADFANNVVIFFSDYINNKHKSPNINPLCDNIQSMINANLNWSPRLYTSGAPTHFMSNPKSLLIFRNAASHSANINTHKDDVKLKQYLKGINRDVIKIKKSKRYTKKVEGSIENVRMFFSFIGDLSLSEARNHRETAKYPEFYRCL